MAKIPIFGQKGQKRAKMPKKAIFGVFRRFSPFLGPWGLPGASRAKGFYINPSRRGPAVPPGGGGRIRAAQARGRPRKGAQGVSPWAVA